MKVTPDAGLYLPGQAVARPEDLHGDRHAASTSSMASMTPDFWKGFVM